MMTLFSLCRGLTMYGPLFHSYQHTVTEESTVDTHLLNGMTLQKIQSVTVSKSSLCLQKNGTVDKTSTFLAKA